MRDSEYDDEKRPRSRGAVITMAVLAVGIIAVIVWTVVIRKTTYTTWESTVRLGNIPKASFIESDSGYVLYNNDGAEGHDRNGRVLWKISYDLASPIAATGGDCAAFADRGANTVHVTDGNGANNVISVSEKISGICVAKQGVTAIRTDGGDSDHIYIYDISGNMLLDIRTEVRTSGFPVTMALSPDGRKLVTSYLKAGMTQESWVTFYNFGDVGQSYADKIVGSYSFEDSLIPDIRFLGNDRVLVTEDKRSILYRFREVPEELKRYGEGGQIASVAGRDGYFVLSERQSGDIYRITVYNSSGSEVSSTDTGFKYDTLNVYDGELILTGGDSCIIYRKNGREKFRSRLEGTITAVVPGGSETEYTVVGEGSTILIRLKNGTEEPAEQVQ